MYCSKCGTKLSEDAKFCYGCGQKVERVKRFCRICGSNITPDMVKCPKCGETIDYIDKLYAYQKQLIKAYQKQAEQEDQQIYERRLDLLDPAKPKERELTEAEAQKKINMLVDANILIGLIPVVFLFILLWFIAKWLVGLF